MKEYKLDFEIIETENGEKYLRRYDKEFNIWVNIHSNPENSNGIEYIKNALKDVFLKQLDNEYDSFLNNDNI